MQLSDVRFLVTGAASGLGKSTALYLSAQWGLLAAGAYLLSGCIGTLAALWLNRELAQNIE